MELTLSGARDLSRFQSAGKEPHDDDDKSSTSPSEYSYWCSGKVSFCYNLNSKAKGTNIVALSVK